MNQIIKYFAVMTLFCTLVACGAGNNGAVIVGDDLNSAPDITLNGDATITLDANSTFSDPGAIANDEEDGNISSNISVESNVDTSTAGEYTVVYSITDSNGNTSTVTRVVVILPEPSAETVADAMRFLNRSTFGNTIEDIDHLMSMSYQDWVDEQLAMSATYQLPDLQARMQAAGLPLDAILNTSAGTLVNYGRLDSWFDAVLNQPDQLRQRVAFALSQIFVISTADTEIRRRIQGVANYNDILVRNAFGNYRDLLEEVTLNPMMGIYLSMRRNEKADPAQNILPDENYAREVMQLFSLGLDLLNPDGTPQLDENGLAIPTYTQNDILNFARVFTGWNYIDAPQFRSNARTVQSEIQPMIGFEDFHDTDSKTLLLGEVTPAGNTAAQDMTAAMDNIFNHPNVGPFISKQLIQKLVTSNPSPAYVGRVAAVFNDNGIGVRGDLGATVKALLLDQEALQGHIQDPASFGKLKEPLLKFTNIFRAFNAEGVVPGRFRFASTAATLGQEHMAPPSVFNFFQPGFSQPGEIRNSDLVSPEFQILDESTAVNSHNELRTTARSAPTRGDLQTQSKNRIILDIDFEKSIADDPQVLVDHLFTKLVGTDINAQARQSIVDYIDGINSNDDGFTRVSEAIYLISLTPDFSVQR